MAKSKARTADDVYDYFELRQMFKIDNYFLIAYGRFIGSIAYFVKSHGKLGMTDPVQCHSINQSQTDPPVKCKHLRSATN